MLSGGLTDITRTHTHTCTLFIFYFFNMDLFKEVKVYYLHLAAQDHQLCFTLCLLAQSLFLFCLFLLATHTQSCFQGSNTKCILTFPFCRVHFATQIIMWQPFKKKMFFFLFPFLSQQPIEVSTEHKETFFGILCLITTVVICM